MSVLESIHISCATEVFLAAALLHREQPSKLDFTIQEIMNRAAKENVAGEMRAGINVHASQHCVANRPPNPARHRMLFATGKHTRRLLSPGDPIHPMRTGKIFPEAFEVPEKYLPLLEWAKDRYDESRQTVQNQEFSGTPSNADNGSGGKKSEEWLSSLFELQGLGREHWNNVDPDEFVRRLREGWE